MTEMSRLRSASLDMTGLRLYCPPTYMLRFDTLYSINHKSSRHFDQPLSQVLNLMLVTSQ